MTKQELLHSIPWMESISIIYSTYTRLPYLVHKDNDIEQIYIFSQAEEAKKFAETLTAEGNNTGVQTVSKKDNLKKLVELFSVGVTDVVFNHEGEIFEFKLNELVKRPTYANIPIEKRPLLNPGLHVNMIYYFQEARKTVGKPAMEQLRGMEEDMVLYMIHSMYIMPLVDREFNGETKSLPLTLKTTQEGKSLIPVFSDIYEYLHFMGDKKFKTILTSFEKMAALQLPPEITGFIIDPASMNAPLPASFMKNALAAYADE